MRILKLVAVLASVGVIATSLVGCGNSNSQNSTASMTDSASTGGLTSEKVFNYGTTAYGVAMGNAGLDPHISYMGWSSVRYGVGETLFKFNEAMELEPWLATSYEQVDDTTIIIYLRDDVTFHNGNKMTGQAVKKCFERLLEKHDRAPMDLDVNSIDADGQTVTFTTNKPNPAFVNAICDPYGAIIDVDAGITEDDNVVGTGPYIAEKVSPTEINLKSYDNYWSGKAKVDKVNVKSITDGDTLTMALQSGEIDATQGLPYASLSLFQNHTDYTISSADTSRLYMMAYNYKTEVLQDVNVRKAIASAIDKEGFTKTLLNGNGTPAVGAFPSNFTFGNEKVTAPAYDLEAAKQLLTEAGYTDTNGDGYVDKNGQNLTIRWLTYTSRQELPKLAESAQATLKQIGIDVKVNATDNYKDSLKKGDFDIYASAFVAAPTGDSQYFFMTHLDDNSVGNTGSYHSERIQELMNQLRIEFDTDKRSDLAIQIQQQVLDDNAYTFASHLKMSFVTKKGVTGFTAHPSDYYEITNKLDIN